MNLSKQRRQALQSDFDSLKQALDSLPDSKEKIQALERIEHELDSKKFGLVFEEHEEEVDQLLRENLPVLAYEDGVNLNNQEIDNFLIEGDNLAGLKVLQRTHKGKVDVIYIDPPYNTGNRDWKYNNDYVDRTDTFRHSKWLSLMEKRLSEARDLLNPDASALIVAIDEHEAVRLGCLLEDMFPYANIQMITTITNRKGSTRSSKGTNDDSRSVTGFSRVEEHLFVVMIGDITISPNTFDMLNEENEDDEISEKVEWNSMLRRGTDSYREDSPSMFYPIFVDHNEKKIVGVGEKLDLGVDRNTVTAPEGIDIVWPIRTNGSEGRWQVSRDTFIRYLDEGVAKLGRYDANKKRWAINYLMQKTLDELSKGDIVADGKDDKGALILRRVNHKLVAPKTVWNQSLHNASELGSSLLNSMTAPNKFSFPKSVYAVRDVLRFFTYDNPDAVILDFFAGSGTTMNAVSLLNAEDNGHRKCILITNNELSEDDEVSLKEQGVDPESVQWRSLGICKAITFPRLRNYITGKGNDGNDLEKEYDMGYADSVKQERQIIQIPIDGSDLSQAQRKKLISLLGSSKLPQSKLTKDKDYAISDKHETAVVFSSFGLNEFIQQLKNNPKISEVYVFASNRDFRSIKDRIMAQAPNYVSRALVTRPLKQGFDTNVAYLRVNYFPIKDQLFYEYADDLAAKMEWSIALENWSHPGGSKVAIANDDEQLEEILQLDPLPNRIYMGSLVLPTLEQIEFCQNNQIELLDILEYYFPDLESR